MRAHLVVVAGLLGLAVIGGCGDDNTGVSTGSTAGGGVTVDDLDGRTFVSTGVDGYTLASGTQVSLSFHDGTLSASAGCNTMSGAAAIEDSKLTGADQLASTLMGCPGELAAQDEWLAGFLQGDPTLALDGRELTMTSGGVTVTLVDKSVADQARPLVGTAWTLGSIVGGQAVSSVPTGVEPPLFQIGEDGIGTIFTGCNRGSAGVGMNGSTVSFGPLRLTKMACPPDAASIEASVVAVLEGDVTFTIDGSRLTLTKGEKGLVYRAA